MRIASLAPRSICRRRASIGRDSNEIERSTLQGVHLKRESTSAVVDRFGELSDAGAQHLIFNVDEVDEPENLEAIGRDVIPQLRDL